MAGDPSEIKNQDKSFVINTAPTVLSIRDVVVVLGVVFAIASSHFTSDSRLTVSETNIKNLTEQIDNVKKQQDVIEEKINTLSTDNRVMVEQNKTLQRDVDELKNRLRDIEKKS